MYIEIDCLSRNEIRVNSVDEPIIIHYGQNIHHQNDNTSKTNYLFSMIPTQPTLNWFKSLDSIIPRFYWKNKTLRIKLTTLQKSKTQGGLEAPHFYHYSLVNQLQYIFKCIHLIHVKAYG